MVAKKVADCDPEQKIVYLPLEQHILAHELLLKCTTGKLNDRLLFASQNMNKICLSENATVSQRYKAKKQIHTLAKKLRKDCHYTSSWEECLKEAERQLLS